jgi:hypothetical protein
MYSYPAINLHDLFELLSVWEFDGSKWKLVTITRISEAITLSNPPYRLAFPIKVKPNQIEGLKPELSNSKNGSDDLSKLLALIERQPGQNTLYLAKKLRLHSSLVNEYLSDLEKTGRIYHKFDPTSRTRLYYPGLPRVGELKPFNYTIT